MKNVYSIPSPLRRKIVFLFEKLFNFYSAFSLVRMQFNGAMSCCEERDEFLVTLSIEV